MTTAAVSTLVGYGGYYAIQQILTTKVNDAMTIKDFLSMVLNNNMLSSLASSLVNDIPSGMLNYVREFAQSVQNLQHVLLIAGILSVILVIFGIRGIQKGWR